MLRYAFSIILVAWGVLLGHSQQLVKLSPEIEMTFPGAPEVFDTLGQKIFNYSDENGYYACIIHHNALPSGKLPMDLKSYYANVYKSLQQQNEQCKLVYQTELLIAGIKAAEFYSTCKEDPEFPEIRYIRFFLYGHELYVLDYWTTKAHLNQAENNKNKFLNSFVLHQGANDAIIPSAISSSDHGGVEIGKYILWACLAGIGVLGFLYFYFNRRIPAQKSGDPAVKNKNKASAQETGRKTKK
jgi:hypothetical protein